MIPDKFLKPYNPQETEPRIYKTWEESGLFNPDNLPKRHKEPYSIIMPPPNVTGVLHMGHALMLTIQDIMIRYKRMRGYKTLWLPGTDHAAIATQSKVEKDIYKEEKKNRHDLGREEFLRRVEDFAKESHDTITSQIRAMGASCDWSREAFTLDEPRSKAVYTVFEKMYKDGLIYRKNRIVNWDPKGQTTISDDEIVREERKATLYTFKYSHDFPIAISTTRPETKVGDVAVAVHPEDDRYKNYIGKEYDADFCGVPIHIKIVADKEVDTTFGTGALGVTPAHSMIDWEMAERHNLPTDKVVINEYAKMSVGDNRIKNKKTTDAREEIVKWLKEEGLMEKEEETIQNISTAERTGGIVEPLPKLQWFIDVNKEFTIPHSKIEGIKSGQKTTLKEMMRKTVESGQIKIMPEYFSSTYFHWIDNLRDWCISRQLWYGHRIPVWYHEAKCIPKENGDASNFDKCIETIVSNEKPKCEFCGAQYVQDPDTLDTWFSSGLWTFSTLGWPASAKGFGEAKPGSDLDLYHPTDVLETGHDIIFFWVARMILMTGYALGDIPFRTVYFNGIVRDAQGRKFSKSLGNGIDPLDVKAEFGADAGRMALVFGVAPGTDSRIDNQKIKGYKNFANKLWNIARFVLSHRELLGDDVPAITNTDRAYLDEVRKLAEDVTDDMERYQLHIAAEKIYQYIWHRFADVILEESKVRLNSENDADKRSAAWTLFSILGDSLKLLHPFMPFVTEEIWSHAPCKEPRLLMIETWLV